MWSMIGGLKSRLDTLSRDTTTFRSTWHEIAVNYIESSSYGLEFKPKQPSMGHYKMLKTVSVCTEYLLDDYKPNEVLIKGAKWKERAAATSPNE